VPGLAATGSSGRSSADFHEYRNGLISRLRLGFNLAEASQQLGLRPAPGSRAQRIRAALPAGAAWAVAQLSPVGAASSAVETGCPAGIAPAPPAVSASIVWTSRRPPTCTRRGLAASATGIVSVSTPCS